MNKTLVTVAAVAAIAGGAYYLTQSEGGSSSSSINIEQLDYVPADSAFFWGQLEAFPYKKYMDLLPDSMKSNQDVALIVDELKQTDDKNARFLAELLAKYQESTESSEKMAQIWGVGDSLRGLGYSVGLLPVLRYEVTNTAAFNTTMKDAAQQAGISFKEEQINGAAVTRYQLEVDGMQGLELVTSTAGNWSTITFNTPFNDESDLKLALALEKPTQSLSQSKKLDKYVADYGLDGKSVAYLNHVAIVDAITAKSQSRLTKMLDQVLDVSGSAGAFDSVRNAQCQADFSDIANKWPATISGTKEMRITANEAYFEMDTVFASTDVDAMKALASVRGFVPQHTRSANNKMMSFAYGVDVQKVAPLLNTLWTRFTKAEFNCEHLLMAQEQAKANNPMAVAMMTGMAGSLKGISVSLQGFSLSEDANGQPSFDNLDAIVSVSADDAAGLFNTLKSFAPPLANVELPEDGSEIVVNDMIPSPVPLKSDIKLALKGKHLTLFTGEQGSKLAANMANEELTNNGFSNFAFDLKSFITPFLSVVELSGEPVPEELEQLKNQNMSMYFSADFAEKGIVFETDMTIKKL